MKGLHFGELQILEEGGGGAIVIDLFGLEHTLTLVCLHNFLAFAVQIEEGSANLATCLCHAIFLKKALYEQC